MRKSKFTLALVSLVALGFASGCSTVAAQRSNRQGLFDRLNASDDRYSRASRPAESTAAAVATEDSRSDMTAAQKKVVLHWPLASVRVTSPFGQRGDEFHEGVDLHAGVGTPVFSAHAGKVLYAGSRISGYGKMVLIKHATGISTIYAHNSKLLVRRGQIVTMGQKIALSGKTGHVTAAHVHFEVRTGTAAVDPLKYLPKVSNRSVASATPTRRSPRIRHHGRTPAAVAVAE